MRAHSYCTRAQSVHGCAMHCAQAQKHHVQVLVSFSRASAKNDSMGRATCGTGFGMRLPKGSYVRHLLHICLHEPYPSEMVHFQRISLVARAERLRL